MIAFRAYLLGVSIALVVLGTYVSLVDGMAHLASEGGHGIIGAIADGLTMTCIGLFIFALGFLRYPFEPSDKVESVGT